jgi:hypothetical protein
MNSPLRTSTIRVIVGSSLLFLALLAVLILLPGATLERTQKQKAAGEAQRALQQRENALTQLQTQVDGIDHSRAVMDRLLGDMSSDSISTLHGRIHTRLVELAQETSVKIQAVKYGAPSREGAKGTNLEALDVEFLAVGVYQNLKPFMQKLETSKLPFAVVGAKLEESPDGARLTVTLRAFRHKEGPASTGEATE